MALGEGRPTVAARPARRALLVSCVLALAVPGLAAAASTAGSSGPEPQVSDGAPGAAAPVLQATVTLVTGDVAQVFATSEGETQVRVRPPAGTTEPRSYGGFVDGDGHHHVIPSDVERLIPTILDPRLFDVTALVRDGFDDGSSPTLALVVQHTGADLAVPGLSTVRSLPSIGASAVRLDRSGAADLGALLAEAATDPSVLAGVGRIWLDGHVHASLDESASQIGAPDAWAQGYDGTGTAIAVLDSGISPDHPDLQGRVVAAEDFSFSGTTDDELGHGTFVSSVVGGTGEGSQGRFVGVAHGADLLNAKVLDSSGWGWESGVIAGMEWAAVEHDADVINISVNGEPSDGSDLMSQAIDALSESEDALFVVAAGNEGWLGRGTIASPGGADAALTVGVVDKRDRVPGLSSLGPRLGDGAVKPEIAAPGFEITAAGLAGSPFGDPVGDGYVESAGSSAAAAHVAGAAAILRQAQPALTWSEARSTLVTSATEVDGTVWAVGGGRVDVPAALAQSVRADDPTVDLGLLEWPHDHGETATAEVTLVNDGDAAVTVDLAVSAEDEDGSAAPAAMLAVEPATVELAPGGSGTAVVTLDPSTGPAGLFSGALRVSDDGGDLLHLPLGFEKEAETYALTVELADRFGGTDFYGFVGITELTRDAVTDIVTVDGSVGALELRVPAGTYGLTFQSDQGYYESSAYVNVTEPEVVVDRDTTVVLDGRTAVQSTVDVPEAVTADLGNGMSTLRGSADQGYQIFHEYSGDRALLFAKPTDEITLGQLRFETQESLAGAARSYHAAYPSEDRVPADLEHVITRAGAAEVRDVMHADVPGGTYSLELGVGTPLWLYVGGSQEIAASETHVSWMVGSGAEGIGYLSVVAPEQPYGPGWLQGYERYEPGDRVEHRWFTQPARPGAPLGWAVAGRADELVAELSLMDADGHFGYADTGVEAPIDEISFRLLRDGEVITESTDLFLGAELPPEREAYELVLDTARTAPWARMSTETRTVWRFESEEPPGGTRDELGLLQVDYDVELDLHNRAAAGAPLRLDVYGTGPVPPAVITSADAWSSVDDGATWSLITLRDLGGGSYEGVPAVPTTCADPCLVSLRVAMADERGTELEQTIMGAYTSLGAAPTGTPTATPTPTPTLPPTGGGPTGGVAALALLVVLAGGLLVGLARRLET